ncbi:MAG: HD domain-containing protein [Candidatus Marsarchaeota archaeon]|nr:HD domain-containing protein [Candidatus Marsarchaeota archaeon]
MKLHITDPLLGDIETSEVEANVIENPAFQRLRYIRQLGFANLVYPGANHTRFEHSIGTMMITKEVVKDTMEAQNPELDCVGLLHDIGHGAFSHYTDSLLNKYLHTTHEKLGEEMIANSELRDILSKSISYKRFANYFRGNNLGQLVTGAIGSDRLDYLSRDAHYTGVAFGVIDYPHIKKRLAIYKESPAVYESGIHSAENVLIARYSMFTSVYYHHTIMIAQGMYVKAVENAIESNAIDPQELKELNDWEMLARLKKANDSRDLAKGLESRRLFKRAYPEILETAIKPEEISNAIEKKDIGRNDYVVVQVQYKGDSDEVQVVNKNGELMGKLTEMSPLVNALMGILKNKRSIIVACKPQHITKVKKAVEMAL